MLDRIEHRRPADESGRRRPALFFVMPYRVRTGGIHVTWAVETVDQKTVRAERWFDKFAMLGLALVILGTVAQIAAIFLPSAR
jgi:hypothetical protein